MISCRCSLFHLIYVVYRLWGGNLSPDYSRQLQSWVRVCLPNWLSLYTILSFAEIRLLNRMQEDYPRSRDVSRIGYIEEINKLEMPASKTTLINAHPHSFVETVYRDAPHTSAVVRFTVFYY